MRPAKKFIASLEMEQAAQRDEMLADTLTEAVEQRSKPSIVFPVSGFETKDKVVKLRAPFVMYLEPASGGWMATTGISPIGGYGPDPVNAARQLLYGLQHRYLYLKVNIGRLAPTLYDEYRSIDNHICLK